MSDWSCRECHGKGMLWNEERQAMVLCDCPSGEAKRRYIESTSEGQSAARRKSGKGKKRDQEQDPIPF